MTTNQTSTFIQHVRRDVLLQTGEGLTDGQLLGCFIERRDDAAFAALVRRHAPMVWSVCRRLVNHQDAEDAFQATFLVLVRKAATIVPREMVANWLYGVARQTALQARRTVTRRLARETHVTVMPEPEVVEKDLWTELQPLLDEELSRLPDMYRGLIVLCDLEGKTRKEVARQLGCPEGTVAGRLARARVMLAQRLTRRGVVLSGGSLATVLAQNVALAGVPTSVASSTIKAATLLTTGQAAGLISFPVAALTEGVLKAMLLSKGKTTTMIVLVLSLVALACGVLANVPADGKADGTAAVPAHDAQAVQTLLTLKGHTEAVLSVCFSPDGKWLASASGDQTVKLWDSRSGRCDCTLQGHTDHVHCVCFSPDGKRLASASHDQTVKVWDVKSGQELLTLKGHTLAVTRVCFSPDGKRLASVGGDRTGKLWDARSGQELLTLKGEVSSVCFSPDGDRLVSGGGFDKTVTVWDVKSGQALLILQGHTDYVRCVCFSRDEQRLASGSFDKTVKVWDAKSGQELRTLKGHGDNVRSVCFSPDGKWLASAGGFDKMVKVWQVKSGQELLTLRGHTSHVGSVCFSPDGQRLASASFDKTVKVWEVEKQGR